MGRNKTEVCALCRIKKKAKSVNYCLECNSILTGMRQHTFKEACLEEAGYNCFHCGLRYHAAAMCFRHVGARSDNVKVAKLTGAQLLTQRVVDQLAYKRLVCTNCERTYYRAKSAGGKGKSAKRRGVVLLGGACTRCGYDESYSALDLHHVDGRGAASKRFAVADRGVSEAHWERIAAELEKCVLLCANCHATEHAEEKALDRLRHVAYNVSADHARKGEIMNYIIDTQLRSRTSRALAEEIAEELKIEDPENYRERITKSSVRCCAPSGREV